MEKENLLKIKSSKILHNCSKEDLIWFVSIIEEKYNRQSDNLREVHTKLSRAKLKIAIQHQQLVRLRRRIVELTPRSLA